MIITTTPTVEGRQITEYHGVVFGEGITGINFVKDFFAGIRNIVGGRSNSYEEELNNPVPTPCVSWKIALNASVPMPS